MALDLDGRLWLVDAGNGRYTVLGPNGDIEISRRGCS
jgi:hypothetical protein